MRPLSDTETRESLRFVLQKETAPDLVPLQLLENEEHVWLVDTAQIVKGRILSVFIGNAPRLVFLRGGGNNGNASDGKLGQQEQLSVLVSLQ